MATSTLTHSGVLTIIDCGECGIVFAWPQSRDREARKDGSYFYCPNGHSIHYMETENARLRHQVERQERTIEQERARGDRYRDRAAHESRRAVSLRGVVTRTKRRIAAGKCPCCHAQFADLQAHMQEQHPGYGDE